MSTPAIQGPVPPYSNVNIAPQNYQPSQFFISAITLGSTTFVTTLVNNNYVIGQQVKLVIPPSNGYRQLNGQQGIVLSLPAANQVEININSYQNVDQFVSSLAANQPQILAIGDINNGQTNANGPKVTTYVQGSFINIS